MRGNVVVLDSRTQFAHDLLKLWQVNNYAQSRALHIEWVTDLYVEEHPEALRWDVQRELEGLTRGEA